MNHTSFFWIRSLLVAGTALAAVGTWAQANTSAADFVDKSTLRINKNAIGKSGVAPTATVSKPVRRMVRVDLSAGAPSEVVRVAFGQGTVLSFLDAAGQPWKVLSVENFNPAVLSVGTLGDNGLSLALKTPTAAMGNLAVSLEGLASPLTLTVAVGQRQVDHLVELQLGQRLPSAPQPLPGAAAVSPPVSALASLLAGIVPETAHALATAEPGIRAWQVASDAMVVQSDDVILSPSYRRRESSASGLTMYELPLTPHLVLLSQGRTAHVLLSGLESAKATK